ncbi:hypothetical protein Tco_0270819 [Tanacetum coccineum]
MPPTTSLPPFMVCGAGGCLVTLVTSAFNAPDFLDFFSTFATANAILLAWFGITIASLFCVFADDDGGKQPISWRGIMKPCNEDTYVVVRPCQVKPTRIWAGHRHQNGVCSHGGANDLLPELEEALYNIQFEQQWLQDENNRQPVGIYFTVHNLLARDQGVVVAVEYDRRQFYGTLQFWFSIPMELSTIAQLTKTSNNKILEAKGNAIQSNMNLIDLNYFNPKLQIETAYSRYKAMYQATPPLTIRKAPYEDATQEKLRNKYPLKTIMEQNPDTYRGIRFTAKPKYSITGHYCLNLVEKYKPADPAKVPPEVLATEGKSCVFQFQFNTVGNMTDLTLDDVFDITNGNESTSSSSHKIIPVTPPSSPAATTHPANKEDQ